MIRYSQQVQSRYNIFMKKLVKIILISIIALIAIFAITKIAISYIARPPVPSLENTHTFTVKKRGAISTILLTTLNNHPNQETLPEKINFLILGNPGEGNNAPDLTDTIILASLKPQDNKLFVFSIPRDLYVRIDDSQNFSKINSLYELGNNHSPRSPADFIIKAVEKMSNEKIDYFFTIDLPAIKKIVDDLNGLNVNVSQTVDDPRFPTANNGYERFHVEKGWRYFDGETTLKYLRTRHSLNGDFDRMQRQQDIVEAFRKKIFGLNIIWDFPKILRIFSELDNHIETNMDITAEAKPLYKTIKNIPQDNLIYKVIDASNGNSLVTTANIPLSNGVTASIVQPKAGLEDYREIQEFIKNTLQND